MIFPGRRRSRDRSSDEEDVGREEAERLLDGIGYLGLSNWYIYGDARERKSRERGVVGFCRERR